METSCQRANTARARKKGVEFTEKTGTLLKMVTCPQCGPGHIFALRTLGVVQELLPETPQKQPVAGWSGVVPSLVICSLTDLPFFFHLDCAKNGFSQTVWQVRTGESGFSPVCITEGIINWLSFYLTGKFKKQTDKQHTFFFLLWIFRYPSHRYLSGFEWGSQSLNADSMPWSLFTYLLQ